MPDKVTRNVFLFIPNLIGYLRIALALLSFHYMREDYGKAGGLYMLSCFLDALDGHAARYFKQESLLGGVLDLITDRVVSPVGLLITLAILYPQYALLFQLFLIIDISSHWFHLHSSILCGKLSHKSIDEDAYPIMKFYYSNRVFLFCMAAGNEMFFVAVYLLHFTQGPLVAGVGVFVLMAYITAPVALLKTAITVIQLKMAVNKIAAIDTKQD